MFELSDNLDLRVVTHHHANMRIYVQTPIISRDMEWEMSNKTEGRLESQQNELPNCEIPTTDHLTTISTIISPPSHHRNPTTHEERDACEGKADSCKDELAVNKVLALRLCNSMVVLHSMFP